MIWRAWRLTYDGVVGRTLGSCDLPHTASPVYTSVTLCVRSTKLYEVLTRVFELYSLHRHVHRPHVARGELRPQTHAQMARGAFETRDLRFIGRAISLALSIRRPVYLLTLQQ